MKNLLKDKGLLMAGAAVLALVVWYVYKNWRNIPAARQILGSAGITDYQLNEQEMRWFFYGETIFPNYTGAPAEGRDANFYYERLGNKVGGRLKPSMRAQDFVNTYGGDMQAFLKGADLKMDGVVIDTGTVIAAFDRYLNESNRPKPNFVVQSQFIPSAIENKLDKESDQAACGDGYYYDAIQRACISTDYRKPISFVEGVGTKPSGFYCTGNDLYWDSGSPNETWAQEPEVYESCALFN